MLGVDVPKYITLNTFVLSYKNYFIMLSFKNHNNYLYHCGRCLLCFLT